METAHDVATRALKRIGVLAAGETADADTAQDVLRAMNNMMAGWELLGVRMNPPAYVLTDEIQLPEAQIEAVVSNLAVSIAPEFGKEPSAILLAMAERQFGGLQAAYMSLPALEAGDEYQVPGTTFPW